MKSRVIPKYAVTRKEIESTINSTICDATDKVAKALTACFMLAAHDALGIGEVRMAKLLEKYSEYAEHFADFEQDDAGWFVLKRALENSNLTDLYERIFEDGDADGAMGSKGRA